MVFQIGHKSGMTGKHHSEKSREKMRLSHLGMPSANKGNHYKLSKETCKRIGDGHRGEKSYNWKGDDVPYRTLHQWVSNTLGKPKKCQYCGKNNLTGHKIHWANISGKYERDKKDWIRLCVKCHSKYDGQKYNKGRVNKEDK